MEIFIGTLLVFLLSCLGLAAGQLFGRKPITGGCTPNSAGHCKNTENCSLRCIKRKQMRIQTGG
jgi:hypothetical protein